MSQLAQDRRLNRMRNAFARSSYPADWYIEDNEKVSQDVDHQEDEFILQSTLLAWKKRTNQSSLLVGCEMACRWDEVERRVVIVDTSNEIGGDGDVPHPAVGSARRMQVQQRR